MTATDPRAKQRARSLWKRWQKVWQGCSGCEYDEAEGDVVDHCKWCTREMALIAIAADLPKLLKRRAS